MTPENQTTPVPIVELRCASCSSYKIRRSHRDGPLEIILSFLGRYPFCCHECKHRFFLKQEAITAKPEPETTTAGHDRPIERRREQKKIEALRRRRFILIVAACLLLFYLFVKYYVLSPPPIVMPD